jgi:hypothetical protein
MFQSAVASGRRRIYSVSKVWVKYLLFIDVFSVSRSISGRAA